jgi:hypothetical protein
VHAAVWSSYSSCSICCGFLVQQVVRLVVKLWICCGFAVHFCSVFRLVVDMSKAILYWFDLLWICRRLCENLWICCATCCSTNARQIEQVEFELNCSSLQSRSLSHTLLKCGPNHCSCQCHIGFYRICLIISKMSSAHKKMAQQTKGTWQPSLVRLASSTILSIKMANKSGDKTPPFLHTSN